MNLFSKNKPDLLIENTVAMFSNDKRLFNKLERVFNKDSKETAIVYLEGFVRDEVIPKTYVEQQGGFHASADYRKSAEKAFNILLEDGKSRVRLFFDGIMKN